MADPCTGLIVFLFAAAAITCVGHLIWVVVAAFLRLLFGSSRDASTRDPEAVRCPLCSHLFTKRLYRCPRCHLVQQSSDARHLLDMRATLRQVDWLVEAQELQPEVGNAVRQTVERRRQKIEQRLEDQHWAANPPMRVPVLAPVKAGEAAPVPVIENVPTHREIPPEAVPAQPPPKHPFAVLVEPAAAAVQAPRVAADPPKPKPPRRSFGEMMAAFMEERNILWGELVGGLLIVGCSIALVISLRQTLEEIPYFPFLIVGALTSALIGAGRYTLSHWKLEATSRGLLLIGMLLVPLSFMVLAGLTARGERGALEVAIELVAVAFFGWLVYGASRILISQPVGPAVPYPQWLTTGAVLGASASLLLASHVEGLIDPASGLIGLAGYAPALLLVMTQGLAWVWVYRQQRITAVQSGGLFLSLGLAVYAVGLAFVFLLCRTDNVGQALEYLALPLALTGLPLLVGGTVASARLRGSPDSEAESNMGGLHPGVANVIATMLSLFGTVVMLLALAAAWPQPIRLTVIGTINFLVLALVAYRFRLGPAYVPAMICLAVAILTGYHGLAGHLAMGTADLSQQLIDAWVSPTSGVVLLICAGILACSSEWLTRKNRTADGNYLIGGAATAALASLLLVAADGQQAPGRSACVFAACTMGVWLVNARQRLVWVTLTGAVILAGATYFANSWHAPDAPLAQMLVWTLLANAGIALSLAVVVDRLAGQREQGSSPWRRVFVWPLQWVALVGSIASALCLLPALHWNWFLGAAGAAIGIGLVWLVLAWRQRWPGLFAAFQGSLAVGAVFGCLRALQTQPWFTDDLVGLLADVRSWHAYGVGLGALAVGWVAVRFGMRKNERAWALLEPGWPAADRLLLGGLVGLAILLTTFGVAGGVAAELAPLALGAAGPTAAPGVTHVCSMLGWCWLGLLAAALGLSLWQGRALGAVPGLFAIGFCVAVTAAAAFDVDLALASAVRWALAGAFVLGSLLLWCRNQVGAIATAVGIRCERGHTINELSRHLLVLAAVAPVLLLTTAVAVVGFAHMQTSGPLATSIFSRIGPLANNLTPLLLTCVGLAGHGIRERKSGYAFAAGQVLLVSVVGGYALAIITAGGTISNREVVQLGQLATGILPVWLLGWLAVRWLGRRQQITTGVMLQPAARGMLLAVQDSLIWISHLLWLAPALLLICKFSRGATSDSADLILTQEAGSWLGWSVAGLAIAAGSAYRLDRLHGVPSWILALGALILAVVFSCTVAIYAPDWDQRALMLVSATVALGIVAILVPPSFLSRISWLRVSRHSLPELQIATGLGALASFLAIARAIAFDDCYWSALAVIVVALAAATVALLRRAEGWMFVGSLLAMVASTLVVCGAFPFDGSAAWAVFLTQVNLATAAAVGLLWLVCRQRIYRTAQVAFEIPPWLCAHQALASLGNVGLLLWGFLGLTDFQGPSAALMLALGSIWGWVALALAAAGSVWLVRLVAPRWTLSVLITGALLAGIQAGCTATRWDLVGIWSLGQHVMTLAWLLTATGVLAAAWAADLRKPLEDEEQPPWWVDLVSAASVGWVLGVGAAVALLVFLGGAADPLRPYWPCGILLGVSALFGTLAVWRRRGDIVFASGLLLNGAGHLMWLAWAGPGAYFSSTESLHRLVLIHAICLAEASLAWSVIEMGGRRRLPLPLALKNFPPFRHFAATASLALLGLAVGGALLNGIVGAGPALVDPMVWLAVAALVAAIGITLWDMDRRWASPLPQLYALGLLAVGSGLHQAALNPQWLGWVGAIALGAYVLLASGVCRLGAANARFMIALHMPHQPGGRRVGWFIAVQAVLSGVVAALAVWVCLTFADRGARLASSGMALFLVPSGGLLSPTWNRLVALWAGVGLEGVGPTANSQHVSLERGNPLGNVAANGPALYVTNLPHLAALLFGVLSVACLHCAVVGPDSIAPLLHRSVALLAAVTWMSAIYGILLPRFLPAGNAWAWMGRRLATPLGIVAGCILLVILVQEVGLYDATLGRTPMGVSSALIVAAALIVLVTGAIVFALSPAWDPLKLSESGRTRYVYAAEVLLVLLVVHLRLTVPEYLPVFVSKYWVFTVMAVAFLGVGLSQLLKRRGLRVLSDPLQRTAMFLPILPLIAYLVQPFSNLRSGADRVVSALDPVNRFLDRMPGDYRWHASIWFLMALLYLVVALTRRSSRLALAAAVIANFGLWVIFGNQEHLTFLAHPQLWLIPLGLIVIAAEQINRDKLQPSQGLALRYAGLLLIYLSSTADLFMPGRDQGVVLPIVLAVLSVAGVLLGILLHIRAFLFLGVTFLFLDVFSQIWRAAVEHSQTWVWWASGIVLGAAILTLFALFEKRRNDVLGLLAELKRWQ